MIRGATGDRHESLDQAAGSGVVRDGGNKDVLKKLKSDGYKQPSVHIVLAVCDLRTKRDISMGGSRERL
jgi:hypothetical protein